MRTNIRNFLTLAGLVVLSASAQAAPLMTLRQCEDAGDYQRTLVLTAERDLTVREGEIDFERSAEGPSAPPALNGLDIRRFAGFNIAPQPSTKGERPCNPSP